MLKYLTIPVTRFEQNCSILWCDATSEAAVIDPGGDLERILKNIADLDLRLKTILLTHTHIDHAGAVADLAEQHGLEIIGPHKSDQFWIDKLAQQSQMLGFPMSRAFKPDRWLVDQDVLSVGESKLTVRHCPGHTPGHVVFHSSEISRVFVGDVLFVGSVGRTDLPMGNHNELVRSIKEKLWPMGDATIFIPGHGPEGRLGIERKTNPFVGEN